MGGMAWPETVPYRTRTLKSTAFGLSLTGAHTLLSRPSAFTTVQETGQLSSYNRKLVPDGFRVNQETALVSGAWLGVAQTIPSQPTWSAPS